MKDPAEEFFEQHRRRIRRLEIVRRVLVSAVVAVVGAALLIWVLAGIDHTLTACDGRHCPPGQHPEVVRTLTAWWGYECGCVFR